MPNQKNIAVLENLKKELTENPSFLIVDCSNISVRDITLLRRKLETVNAYLKVAKNRLIRIALKELKTGSGSEDYFKGPTALILIKSDPIAPIKILQEYIKAKERPNVKALFVFDNIYAGNDFDRFAMLHSIDEERAIFLGQLQAPIAGLLYTLDGIIQKLVGTIEEVKHKKEA